MKMNNQIHDPVLDQLKGISKTLEGLETYETDVAECTIAGYDLESAIFYSKLNDQIKQKIKEIEEA